MITKAKLLSLVSSGILLLTVGTGTAQLRPLNVSYIPISDCLPLFVGVEKGYFAEEGLDLKLTLTAGGPPVIAALMGGSFNIVHTSVISMIVPRSRAILLKFTTPSSFVRTLAPGTNGLMVRKDSGINSLKDLDGKKIVVNVIRSISQVMVGELLIKNGVNLSGITWVEVNFPEHPQVLLTRQVDAVAAVEPFITVLKDSGEAKMLAHQDIETIPGLPMAGYAGDEKWLAKNRDLVERFNRAHAKGVDAIAANEDNARSVFMKWTKMKPELARRITLHKFGNTVKLADIDRLQKLAFKYKLIDKEIDPVELLFETLR